MHLDVLIQHGLVVDGSGNPGFYGSVGIADGVIHIVRGSAEGVVAADVVDATGRVVCPGFIDMHSHSGLSLLVDGAHEAKVRQGVTSELIGVDGNSYAPFARVEDLQDFRTFNAGLDGSPEIDYDWDNVNSFLQRFDGQATVNTATMIGNSALRIAAVGWDAAEATPAQCASMRSMLREGLQEGAFGISTGLDYPPGAFASTAELVELAEEAARLGAFYHTHVRYQLGDKFLDPFREAVQIGRRSGSPVHLTHLYRKATAPRGAAALIDYVEETRESGLDITFDTYPYEWSSTRLTMLVPIAVQSGGPAATLRALADQDSRAAVEAAIRDRSEQYGGPHVWSRIRLGYFRKIHNQIYEGRSIAEVAEMRDQSPARVVCELLVDEELGVNEVAAGPDGLSIPRFVAHPLGMVGSDSVFFGERPSPRTYGSFTRILGELVREERLVSLSEAVRKMTSFPAQRLGLRTRGLIRDGLAADVVVFDPATVRSNATYEQPRRFSTGIDDVFVNGIPVLRAGRMTGARPGRSLRMGQS